MVFLGKVQQWGLPCLSLNSIAFTTNVCVIQTRTTEQACVSRVSSSWWHETQLDSPSDKCMNVHWMYSHTWQSSVSVEDIKTFLALFIFLVSIKETCLSGVLMFSAVMKNKNLWNLAELFFQVTMNNHLFARFLADDLAKFVELIELLV